MKHSDYRIAFIDKGVLTNDAQDQMSIDTYKKLDDKHKALLPLKKDDLTQAALLVHMLNTANADLFRRYVIVSEQISSSLRSMDHKFESSPCHVAAIANRIKAMFDHLIDNKTSAQSTLDMLYLLESNYKGTELANKDLHKFIKLIGTRCKMGPDELYKLWEDHENEGFKTTKTEAKDSDHE